MRTTIRQLLAFGLVGCIGFIVNATAVILLSSVTGPGWAQVAGFPSAVFVTWMLNRNFTFRRSSKNIVSEFSQYVVSNALGAVLNNMVYFSLILKFAYAYENPALAVAMGSICGMTLNFIFTKYYVYRHHREPHA